MCRRPKSGKLVSVRAALCLRCSNSSWRRHWLAGLGVQVANQRHVSLHHADITKDFPSSLHPKLVQSLVVRLDTFAIASRQRINIAESYVVPIGTLPPPPPIEAVQRADSLTVVASKKCLGVTFTSLARAWPATDQVCEPVWRERLRRQCCRPPLGHPPQPSALWDTCIASVKLMCSRLLGLDISATGRPMSGLGHNRVCSSPGLVSCEA
jgi:hypothetical protein